MRKNIPTALSELRSQLARIAPARGDRLPPERRLAQDLQCSRQTLRACYDILEAEGEIWRHVGQGTFRGPRPAQTPLRDALLVDRATPREVMSARLLLEPQVAAEAALHHRPDDVRILRAKVREGRHAVDYATCERADSAFHRAIAEASHNAVLIGFLVYLSGTRHRIAWQREWDQTYRQIAPREFQTTHSDQHARIVDAIATADAAGAAAAMQTHLQTIQSAMHSDHKRGVS